MTPEENVKTKKIVEDAKSFVCKKVAENTKKIIAFAFENNIQPSIVGEYCAYCRILGEEPAHLSA